jgi:ACT domain-containing protein
MAMKERKNERSVGVSARVGHGERSETGVLELEVLVTTDIAEQVSEIGQHSTAERKLVGADLRELSAIDGLSSSTVTSGEIST